MRRVLQLRYPRIAPFVFAHGRPFSARPRPAGMRKRHDGWPFVNAVNEALEDPEAYTYCEGFARNEFGWWFHHAWIVDRDGIAIDPTWADPGTGYFGVLLLYEPTLAAMMRERHPFGTWLETLSPRERTLTIGRTDQPGDGPAPLLTDESGGTSSTVEPVRAGSGSSAG